MSGEPVALRLARFTSGLTLEQVPAEVRAKARRSILDAAGVAWAASATPAAKETACGVLSTSGAGDVPVFGLGLRLPPADAALLNGVLIHSLEYDDTYLPGAVHPTASLLPVVLSATHLERRSGADLLCAYIAGLEAMARLGQYGGVRLREAGLHPTSVLGVFGCALAAARLMRLSPAEAAMAQGIALSMASGTVGHAAEGAVNKRLHPGLAAQGGIRAAAMARAGLKGPALPYEGARGLFRFFDDEPSRTAALHDLVDDLGVRWAAGELSLKPIPACHLTHGCADAAARLRHAHAFDIDQVCKVTARVPAGIVREVCEPLEVKRRPVSGYAAQFSLPYIVAAALVRGQFGFDELDDAATSDPSILALASRVEYEVDPDSTYPRHRPGEVIVEFRDGTAIRHREAVNRGCPDRPLSDGEVNAKFRANAARAGLEHLAAACLETVAAMDENPDGAALVETLTAGRREGGYQ